MFFGQLPASVLVGLIVGSFLNVCIYRLPRGESVVFPASHCPHCQQPIAWYDNIPLLSYLLLRGRCRQCGQGISRRYPLVEASNALLWLLAAWRIADPLPMLIAQLFSSALLCLSLIDLQELIIPDEINLFLAALGLASCVLIPQPLWWERLLGALLGGGLLLLLAELSLRIWKKEGMGGGDIKLMAAVGLLLGWRMTLLALFLSSFIALFYILIALMLGRDVRRSEPIPFGPALATASLLAFYFGSDLIHWYIRLILG